MYSMRYSYYVVLQKRFKTCPQWLQNINSTQFWKTLWDYDQIIFTLAAVMAEFIIKEWSRLNRIIVISKIRQPSLFKIFFF